ncbi:MAG: 16S rRNA (cytidine(1402)-2'-O)-methyltransferase [Christensenellales bacterium]
MNGTLYVCATPIGNLEDITLRAIRILREADVIAAEDTRHTVKLLNHLGIKKPMISYHEHNERERTDEILALLAQGKDVALVSDAGLPGISDPGQVVIAAAIENNCNITVLPGANAALCALVLSGLDSARFVFEGFLPVAAKERKERLQALKSESRTVVFYEAPHRIGKTLRELADCFGDRQGAIVREISKIHEETLRMTLEKLAELYVEKEAKGEFVLVVEGAGENKEPPTDMEDARNVVKGFLACGMSKKDAVKETARILHISRNELYNAVARNREEE